MTDSTKQTDRTRPLTDTSTLTGTRAQIFQALTDHPGSSAAALAVAAGLGRSTAGKALATLEGQRIALRVKGDPTPGKATPDLWHPHPDTAPGQVHPLPDQATAPEPETAAPETASAEEEETKTKSTDSSPDSGASAEAHPATDAEAGAPQSPASDPEVQPDECAEPAPQQDQPAHTSNPDPDPTGNPPEEHSDAAPRDAQSTAPQSGEGAPAPQSPQPPSEAVATTGEPASVARDPQPPADITRSAPEPGKPCPTCGHVRPSDTVTDSGRLRPGALREMVIAFLAARPDEAFTATAISRHVERSSGAIANSLVTLTKDGIAQQVSESPRRYQYIPPQSDTPSSTPN
ncbi:hypothetical protein ACQEU8_33180 [Streptomyces sp. CA-250714]|uniref:hypothetical protein n=1 Tax=Streptomyces sp. CA-250714 TaxID=3240060 RepID=UPI003D8E0F83